MTHREITEITRFQALSASLLAGAMAIPLMGFAGNANAQYYGNNYNNYANQERLRCDSRDGRQNVCRPQIQANQIQLVRKFSKAQCIENRTFGLTRDGMVWVSNGCRADFVVSQTNNRWGRNVPRGNAYGYGRNNGNSQGNGYGANGGYAYGQTFRCESTNGRENFCNVDTRAGIQMIRQLSSAACINGRTFGVQNNGVWVTNGCRAEFAIGRY